MGDQCLTKEFRDRRSKEHITTLFHSNTLSTIKKLGVGEGNKDRFGSPSSIIRMDKVTMGENNNLAQH